MVMYTVQHKCVHTLQYYGYLHSIVQECTHSTISSLCTGTQHNTRVYTLYNIKVAYTVPHKSVHNLQYQGYVCTQ